MNKSMMEILACPIDKAHPLELYEAVSEGGAVAEGALYCPECTRFYMITGGIPVMLPDELRDRAEEAGFLERHRGALPAKVVTGAAPWHL